MGSFSILTRFFSVIIILCLSSDFGSATDTITYSQFIKDPETLISSGGSFTLGFFSPQNSTNRYVGIWYMSQLTIVWVANRNQPLKDSASTVTISGDGNLVVQNGQNQIIWSSNVTDIASNTTCQLLDSGNLVLLENSGGNIVWQSFEHPSDTYLPNMKISSNKLTGKKVKYISWRSPSDPSLGNFSMSLERLDLYELFIWNGTRPYWRSGPWNGRSFTGIPLMSSKYNNGDNIVSEMDGTVYFKFNVPNGSDFKGLSILNSKGKSLYKRWDDAKKIWRLQPNILQQSDCDIYGICGPFGSCNSESSPICNCLRGFEPSSREEWSRQNWDGGCVRRTAQILENGHHQLQKMLAKASAWRIALVLHILMILRLVVFHIGLLCVQDLAIERPSMSTVVSMLNSEIVNLPPPRQPVSSLYLPPFLPFSISLNSSVFSSESSSSIGLFFPSVHTLSESLPLPHFI